jgi:hypothetical protein
MMKLAQVYIQDLQSFNNFQLDLTYPEGHARAGKAMDRVCFLGRNGVGKSNLMQLLIDYLRNLMRYKSKTLVMVKLEVKDRLIYGVHVNNTVLFFRDQIDEEPEWMIDLLRDQAFTMAFNRKYEQYCIGFEEDPELFDVLWMDNNTGDLILHQPADYARDFTLKLTDSPQTKGHEAESLVHSFPFYNELSPERSSEFWALLIYRIVKRGRDWNDFQLASENKGKPLAALEKQFDAAHPAILPRLAELWEPYLAPLGIELALDQAELPVHYRERLSLGLRRKRDRTKVEFGQLGTGLRHLLFRLGHVLALNDERPDRNSFVFLENPEANLHPALQEDLVHQYAKLSGGSQLFTSTHSPMIAGQFEPEERIILARDAKGNVSTHRGSAPKGATAEVLLAQDFV